MANNRSKDGRSLENMDDTPVNGRSIADYSRETMENFMRSGDRSKLSQEMSNLRSENRQVRSEIRELKQQLSILKQQKQTGAISTDQYNVVSGALTTHMQAKYEEAHYIESEYNQRRDRFSQELGVVRGQVVAQSQRHMASRYSQSNIQSRIYQEGRKSSNYLEILEQSKSMTSSQLESRNDELEKNTQQYLLEMKKHVGKVNSADEGKVKEYEGKIAAATRERAILQEARNVQRREGRDLAGAMNQSQEFLQRSAYVAIQNDPKLQNMSAKDVAKTLEEFQAALKNATKVTEEFVKSGNEADIGKVLAAQEEASKKEEEYNTASRNASQAPYRRYRAQMAIAGGLGAAADLTRYFGYQHGLEIDHMQTQYAMRHADRYRDYEGAANLDVASMRRIMASRNDAAREGNAARKYEAIASGLDIAASGVEAYANLNLGTFLSSTIKGGSPLKGFATQVGQMAPSLANIAKGGVRLLDGLPQAEAALHVYDSQMALQDAVNSISDEQMQSSVDFRRSMVANTLGAGGRANALYDFGTDSGNMRRAAMYGLSPQEMAGIMGRGVSALGSDFTADMALSAGRLQKSGYMSAAQYMGNMSSLVQAGGGADDLESILRNAVAAGMDDAKSVAALVSGISNISQRTSNQLGISTIEGVRQNMMGVAQAGEFAGLTAAQRAQLAMSNAARLSETTGTQDVSIANIMEYANLRKLGSKHGVKMDYIETQVLQGMEDEKYAALIKKAESGDVDALHRGTGIEAFRNMDPAKAADFLKEARVNSRIAAARNEIGEMGVSPDEHRQIEKYIRDSAGAGSKEKQDEIFKEFQKTTAFSKLQAKEAINKRPAGWSRQLGVFEASSADVTDLAAQGGELENIIYNMKAEKDPARRKEMMEKAQSLAQSIGKRGTMQEAMDQSAQQLFKKAQAGNRLDEGQLLELAKVAANKDQDQLRNEQQTGARDFKLPGGEELKTAGTQLQKAASELSKAAAELKGIKQATPSSSTPVRVDDGFSRLLEGRVKNNNMTPFGP